MDSRRWSTRAKSRRRRRRATCSSTSKGNVVPGRSTATALAAGIPGEAAGWAHLATKYGRLPLKTSLQPAIRLAREGFPLNTRLRGGIEAKRNLFQAGAAAKIFLVKGEVPAVGTIIKQPELAQTLTALAEQGPDGFYKGAVAKRMVDGVRKLGGIWSLRGFRELSRRQSASRCTASIAARASSRRRRRRRAASRSSTR